MAVYAFIDPGLEAQAISELEDWKIRRQRHLAAADPDVAAQLVAIRQTWPDIPNGALVALAMAGVDPLSDIAEDVERRAVQAQADAGAWDLGETTHAQQLERDEMARAADEDGFSWSRGLKAGVRGVFAGAESAFTEAVSRPLTAASVSIQDPQQSFDQAYRRTAPSLLGLVGTDEFSFSDLGEGWLPSGEVAQRKEQLKHRLQFKGTWMSPGRSLAVNVTEPGTRAFNLTSGFIDATAAIALDPTAWATAGASRLRMASKVFATDNALIRGIRRMPDEQFTRHWYQTDNTAQRLRNDLTADTDAYSIWRKLGGPQGKIDRELAVRLADARTLRELDDVLLPALGPHAIREKPIGGVSRHVAGLFGDDLGSVYGLGYHVRRQVDFGVGGGGIRTLQWAPDGTIDIADPERAAVTLHRGLRAIKATEDESREIMNAALRIGMDATPTDTVSTSLGRNLGREAFRDTYNEVRGRVVAASRPASRFDLTDAQRQAFDDGNMTEFLRLRGHSKSEIDDISKMEELLTSQVAPTPWGHGRQAWGGANFGKMLERTDPDQLFDVLSRRTNENWVEVRKQLGDLAVTKALRDSVGEATNRAAKTRESKIRNRIGRIFDEEYSEVGTYVAKEAGKPRGGAGTLAHVGDDTVNFADVPTLATEMIGRHIPMPDNQMLRRNIGAYAKVTRFLDEASGAGLGKAGVGWGSGSRAAFEGVNDIASMWVSRAWKPMVLIRGAYIPRVVGEEQLRMAAVGLDSMFRHPVSFLSWMVAKKNLPDVVERYGYRLGGRAQVGPTGELIEDMADFQKIIQRSGGGFLDDVKPGQVGTGRWTTYRRFRSDGTVKDDAEFARAWADTMSKHINDPISQTVARLGPQRAKEYLRTAEGQKLVGEVAQMKHLRELPTSQRALDDYVDNIIMPRIEAATGGNDDLIRAIASGNLDGQTVRWTGRPEDSRHLHASLRNRLDEVGVTEIAGREFIPGGQSRWSEIGRAYDKAIQVGGDWVMSKPTNQMARFRAWQQFWVRNMEEQLGFMDAPTQRALINWAKTEGRLSRSQVARMEKTAAAGQGSMVTDIETADLIARAAAVRDTRRLLYELTERGQFSQMAHAAAPFAEAWKEILLTWGRIVRDRPQIVRRGQQAVEGARGSGFFYHDPSSNQEMFAYPGGKFVSRGLLSGTFDSPVGRAVLGIPGVGPVAAGVRGAFMDEQPAEFEMTGTVTGLNLFAGTVLPGFGPAVSVPAAFIVPDRPELEWVRDNILFPFGEPDVERGIIESQFPAWLRKYFQAARDPESDRLYANTVGDVMAALVATGDYSMDTDDEMRRTLEVAKEKAKGLWLIRGAAQFVVPTGPSIQWQIKDFNDDYWPVRVAAGEFRRMQQEHGEQEGMEQFIATFGIDMLPFLQAKSREIVHRPVSAVGDDWIRRNQDIADRYRLAVGFIAPDDETGEFNYAAYLRHFDEGFREQLRPDQMAMLANNMLGRYAYQHGVEQIERFTTSETDARAARSALRAELAERFPGFNSHVGVRQRPPVDQIIGELERMVDDPDVNQMPVVQAIAEYLAARRTAQMIVDTDPRFSRSTGFTRSAETAPLRRYLRAQGEAIAADNSDFRGVWERVFDRELAEDDDPVLPGQVGAATVQAQQPMIGAGVG